MTARLQVWLSALLIVLAAILAGVLATRHAVVFDWTAGHRNTLTPASRQVLSALDAGPIVFTAYIYPGSARHDIRQRLARYTRTDDRIRLVFADPARHPDIVRRLGIGPDGAVVASYQGRQTTLKQYDEAHVTQALQRLSPDGNPWIVFVTGHGERDPNDGHTAGYQKLAQVLDTQGLRTRTLNLASGDPVPENTGLLVIASPQKRYLPGEVKRIQQYVARGGTLLWVDDPGARYGLTPLAQTLGVHFEQGTMVFPDYRSLGTPSPAIAVIASYPDTPITRSLDRITLFSFAGAIEPLASGSWRATPFLRTSTRSWLETGSLDGASVTFQPDHGDQRGPQTLGLMLQRAMPSAHRRDASGAHGQRAVVLADSDFMDNGHLDTLGNRTLALSIVQWLVGRDDQISVDVSQAPDARLEMAPSRLGLLRSVFVIGLPALLVAVGLLRGFIRRRR